MNPRSKAAASSTRRMMVSLAFSSLAVAIMSFAALAGDGIASRLYWNRFGEVQRVAVDNPTVIETAFDFQPLGTIHDILVDEAGGRVLVGRRGPDDIAVCGLDGSDITRVVDTSDQGLGFDYDPVEDKVYWVQLIRVRRANLDGSDEQVVALDTALRSTDTTGVDIVNRKIYWTASFDSALRRADLDGTNVETVDTNASWVNPAAMRIDGAANKIFWTRSFGQLLVADLDGSDKVSIDAGGVTNFTIDRSAQKIYWAKTGSVYRANYDGSSIETLFDAPIVAMGLRASENALYAADEGQDGLLRYDIATGDRERLWEGLPQSAFGEILIDSTVEKYYWADFTDINRSNFDGSRGQAIGVRDERPEQSFFERSAIARDDAGRIYWFDETVNQLVRANGDGSNREVVTNLDLGGDPVGDLEIDTIHGKLYLLVVRSETLRHVGRMNLDGSQKEFLTSLSYADDFELDPAAGYAYYCVPDASGKGQTGRILRTDLVFGNEETLVLGNASPHSIALDPTEGKIYWIDYYTEVPQDPCLLRSANLADGSGVTDLVQIPSESFDRPHELTIEADIPAPEDRCRAGLVNADADGLRDTLFVNGIAGNEAREVIVAGGNAILAEMIESVPAANQAFVVHANFGAPTDATVTPLPRALGSMCFPLLLSAGATPDAVWNGLGKESQLGESTDFAGMPIADPAPAPFAFLDLPSGDAVNLPAGTTVTFQGVLRDPVSLGRKPVSPTNAVILLVQ